MRWVALSKQDGVLAILRNAIKGEFDKNGSNNLNGSSLLEELNNPQNGFLAKLIIGGAQMGDLLAVRQSLIADDGTNLYSDSEAIVSLPSQDEYRNYRDHIPMGKAFWTSTPLSCGANGQGRVRMVLPDGCLSHAHASTEAGARPVIKLAMNAKVEI
jgi:hypothetical protein